MEETVYGNNYELRKNLWKKLGRNCEEKDKERKKKNGMELTEETGNVFIPLIVSSQILLIP